MNLSDRMTALLALQEQGVIPVFYDPNPEVCIAVIQSCLNAGARCVEFTNRGDFAPRVFMEVCHHFSRMADRPLLGIGSIVDAPTAAIYLAHGARFVVGPLLNAEVARLCNRRGVAYLPGCATATEIGQAQELGCEIIKLFPGEAAGGPQFVKSIMAPMPWARLMPTGGVEPTEASLRDWFASGVAACGIGSQLIRREWVAARDYAAIETAVRQTLEMLRRVRTELAVR